MKPKFLVITWKLNRSDGKMSDTNINTDGKTTEDTFEDDEEEASENSDMEDNFLDMENESEGDEEDLQIEFWAWMPGLSHWPMQWHRCAISVLTQTDMLMNVTNKDCRIEIYMIIVNTITVIMLVGLQAAVLRSQVGQAQYCSAAIWRSLSTCPFVSPVSRGAWSPCGMSDHSPSHT